MSTSIGHTFLYNLIILFIIIIFAFLSGTLSYYKAFKVNNRIVYIIPRQVQLASIKNTEGTHIVIEAQAEKYEQLGYFKAALSTSGYLLNVTSTSGTKNDGVVQITIEGDLP